jgi:hypothetical protein
VRRTTPHPAFQAFDAPSREVCTVARPRTNTPLQALVTLNDPTFVEAARLLAERVWMEGGSSPTEQLIFAFRRAVVRPPTDVELQVLERYLDRQRTRFQKEPDAAAALARSGQHPASAAPPAEIAAWTAVCNMLLNLDETMCRE